MSASLSLKFELWDDGATIEIGPDEEASELIQVRQKSDDQTITLTRDGARKLVEALTKLLEHDLS